LPFSPKPIQTKPSRPVSIVGQARPVSIVFRWHEDRRTVSIVPIVGRTSTKDRRLENGPCVALTLGTGRSRIHG